MTNVAYYKNGLPYDKTNQVIITITNGPLEPARTPAVFVNWPGISPEPYGGGVINYNPGKLPFHGLYLLREGQNMVNKIIEMARAAIPEQVDKKRDLAVNLLKAIEVSVIHNNPDIYIMANELQDAINSLNINLTIVEELQKSANAKAAEAENAYISFMKEIGLHKFIDKSPDIVESIIAISGSGYHKLWEKKVTSKFRDEIEEKNKLINHLDHIKTVTIDMDKKKETLESKKRELANETHKNDYNDFMNSINYTANFYKELTEKLGAHFSNEAKRLAEASKGKKIRNIDEALASFEKYGDVLNKKFNVKDRNAMANALESVNFGYMEKNLSDFSKAFGYTGKAIDFFEIVWILLPAALKSGNYKPVLLKIEAIAAGAAATALTAFAFSIMLSTPLGILGYAVMMTLVSAFVDEKLMADINSLFE